MKKKSIAIVFIAVALSVTAGIVGFGSKLNIYGGWTDLSALHVRVNGSEVEFTDAHPYIDENNRTMIPLRAAVEALGAEVTWNQATRTASISKNGITVHVTIDSATLTVEQGGAINYVTMDTKAVLNPEEGRTYVPIRYVAESLGAFVDYSDAFRTVGIYQDQLTPDEISYLQSFTWDLPASMYDDWDDVRDSYSGERFERYWPYHNVTPLSFANARECLYDHNPKEELSYALEFVRSTLYHQSDLYSISFRTDSSCMLTSDDGSGIEILFRGYLSSGGWCPKPEKGKDYSHCREEANDLVYKLRNCFRNGLRTDNRNAYIHAKNVTDGSAHDFGREMTCVAFKDMPVEVLVYRDPDTGVSYVTDIIILENPIDYICGGPNGTDAEYAKGCVQMSIDALDRVQ